MIFGIGTDLTDIRRIEAGIERFGDRFIERLFTLAERELAERKQGNARINRYAKYFAAKEAAIKALGGSEGQGFSWHDFEVSYVSGSGKPTLKLHGRAQASLTRRLPKGHEAAIHLSLSDEYPYAQAFVVVELR